ncbi:hypothetical protein Aph02nite_08540 [Actinoplanes philippinensis]|uniref:Uncharacterized protein n=1 Tax=Actinoplanes philippinensis TaxID=35752 RepID=A0A1I2AFC6_9ACTN|nr:hypothetical protein [Actinoplanes philippinensis]GIE74904.1 hypothetical protein Aph02nite_08540 [Actinoplanes philippinensis]SFE42705.1 hypothetical protein SAMN05421541_101685 [Actinoplanes philippinensis]
MAPWTTPGLRALLDEAGPCGRAEALTELRTALAGREAALPAALGPADAEIARIAALLVDDLAEPHLLQLRSVDRPDETRLVTTPAGRALRATQLHHAERMRRRAVGVLCAEPPDVPAATHVRYLTTATGMLAFGDYYELIALIVTFPFDDADDPRAQRGARDMAMASHATAATRMLFEVDLTAPALDVTYQSMWVRMMADARERELLPAIRQWRRWAGLAR